MNEPDMNEITPSRGSSMEKLPMPILALIIGLIAVAGYAWWQTAPVSDHEVRITTLEEEGVSEGGAADIDNLRAEIAAVVQQVTVHDSGSLDPLAPQAHPEIIAQLSQIPLLQEQIVSLQAQIQALGIPAPTSESILPSPETEIVEPTQFESAELLATIVSLDSRLTETEAGLENTTHNLSVVALDVEHLNGQMRTIDEFTNGGQIYGEIVTRADLSQQFAARDQTYDSDITRIDDALATIVVPISENASRISNAVLVQDDHNRRLDNLDSRVGIIQGSLSNQEGPSTVQFQQITNRVNSLEAADADRRLDSLEGQNLDSRLRDVENVSNPMASRIMDVLTDELKEEDNQTGALVREITNNIVRIEDVDFEVLSDIEGGSGHSHDYDELRISTSRPDPNNPGSNVNTTDLDDDMDRVWAHINNFIGHGHLGRDIEEGWDIDVGDDSFDELDDVGKESLADYLEEWTSDHMGTEEELDSHDEVHTYESRMITYDQCVYNRLQGVYTQLNLATLSTFTGAGTVSDNAANLNLLRSNLVRIREALLNIAMTNCSRDYPTGNYGIVNQFP